MRFNHGLVCLFYLSMINIVMSLRFSRLTGQLEHKEKWSNLVATEALLDGIESSS